MLLMLKPVSWGMVLFDDFSGLLYMTWVSFVDAGDELCLSPLDDAIIFVGMLDDRRLVILSPLAMGFVFTKSGRKISTTFSNVHFPSFAGNLVHTRS